jgi:MmyB-like transcription regulator ligand binding domain/Helix-turn-helix domain
MVIAREKLFVNESTARREELKSFLRNRRARLSPADFGFNDGTRRRTPGLRRDEVAQLASIGTTTYTFLEQGRDINVSTNVLEKLADVLRLTEQEKRHFFRLAIGELPQVTPVAEEPFPALGVLLESLGSCPGFILNYKFDVIATNEAASLVLGFKKDSSGLEQNVLWRMFTDPRRKSFYENWHECATCVVAYFRWNYAKYIGDEDLAAFIHHLETSSEEFRQLWSEYEVFDPTMLLTPLHINHTKLGALTANYVLLAPFGYPNFTVCALAPDPNTDSGAKIEQYLETYKQTLASQ